MAISPYHTHILLLILHLDSVYLFPADVRCRAQSSIIYRLMKLALRGGSIHKSTVFRMGANRWHLCFKLITLEGRRYPGTE